LSISGGTAALQSPHHLEVKGLSTAAAAAATMREKKMFFCQLVCDL